MFQTVARDLASLPVKSAWIDGEVVVVDAQGRTSFQALQNALTAASSVNGLAFFAFDLMYRDGYDLRGAPLSERKRLLHEVIGRGAGTVKPGPEVADGGETFFRQACAMRLEGAIYKKADSLYAAGRRTREWIKVKCVQRQEMVIGGYTDPQGSRQGFGALLLGYYDGGALRYAGKVGTGFDDKLLRMLGPQLKAREQGTPGFVDPPRGFAAKGAHWIRPDLVAEVAFTEWSKDGALRHPSFQGLRLDKKATEVVRERPTPAEPAPAAPRNPAPRACERQESVPIHRTRSPASRCRIRTRSIFRKPRLPSASSRNTTRASRRGCCRILPGGRSAWCAVPTAGRGNASIRNMPTAASMTP